MSTKILLISGKARSGKDYIGEQIKKRAESDDKNVLVIHFADALKNFCSQHCGYKNIKDESDRQILQYVGTDVCRRNYEDTWVDIVIALLKGLGNVYDIVLIPDARFPNEITKIVDTFGKENVKSLRVHRDFMNDLTDEQNHHQSETALDNWNFDYIIENNGNELLIDKVYKSFIQE